MCRIGILRRCSFRALALLLKEEDLSADNRVVFEEAEGCRGTRPGEGVEEAGHGHRQDTDRDDTGLCFLGHRCGCSAEGGGGG